MIPTMTIATETDARLIGLALWDVGQALRKVGDVDGSTRAYELSGKAFEECKRIQEDNRRAALFDGAFV